MEVEVVVVVEVEKSGSESGTGSGSGREEVVVVVPVEVVVVVVVVLVVTGFVPKTTSERTDQSRRVKTWSNREKQRKPNTNTKFNNAVDVPQALHSNSMGKLGYEIPNPMAPACAENP